MGDTGKSSGAPGPAPAGAAARICGRRRGHKEAAPRGPEQDSGPALADLYHTYYRSLIRLAALLTADTSTAETVVVDSFVALHRVRKTMRTCDDALLYLRRLVVARSRPAARQHRPASGQQLAAAAGTPGRADRDQDTPRFENSAVVLALGTLPSGQREAVVLTLYLNLTEEQAAAAMRVSQATLRRHLAAARTALRAMLPSEQRK